MATAVRRSAVERSASHSRRDAVVQQFLSLADALARRFQQRFPGLIELDDARQVARYELIRAADPKGVYHVYEGADHAFTNSDRPNFSSGAAALAHARTLDFLEA